ncbi:MAG TPA: nuclear transport factor 2 family protein [Thermoplasmata archaeon]|nr:nuclear transport factor 2 family protein [Thermoplasmata archaeon]
MGDEGTTRRVVEGFFAAWTSKDEGAARRLLDDDLEYVGPLNTYHRADDLMGPLMRFAASVRAARMVDLVVEGERAALLYDVDLPRPVGTLRTASFQHVVDGRIRSYLQAFDATELRKVTPRPAGAT